MDLEALRDTTVGQVVPISGTDKLGRDFSHFAFLPDHLPALVQLQPTTWNSVAKAASALGRLHQACAPLPNPGLLIAPALVREAVDTSALEGTYGALADVMEARLSDTKVNSPEIAEIRAYERAAYFGFDWVKTGPVTIPLLEHLQGMLVAEAQVPQRDPGKVREHQVVIGPRDCSVYEARYIPPPPDDRLRAGLDDWIEWFESDREMPAVLMAAIAHYQFESLHPFGDGNGRIGRLLIVLQMLRLGALSEPAITISPWLRRRRDAYQDHLLSVSRTGNWDPWVQFFCEGVWTQADAAVAVVDKLMTWLANVRADLNERHWTGTVASICEDLIDWPVISNRFVQDRYGVSGPTAKSAIDRLVQIGVLRETSGRAYNRTYAASRVMQIVEEM
ncbi:Fic family protein [Aeromicrobium alkaliterrae]